MYRFAIASGIIVYIAINVGIWKRETLAWKIICNWIPNVKQFISSLSADEDMLIASWHLKDDFVDEALQALIEPSPHCLKLRASIMDRRPGVIDLIHESSTERTVFLKQLDTACQSYKAGTLNETISRDLLEKARVSRFSPPAIARELRRFNALMKEFAKTCVPLIQKTVDPLSSESDVKCEFERGHDNSGNVTYDLESTYVNQSTIGLPF
ncbi:hypothetical protein LTR37_021355 [Vermiconidia calcicola]|uniref:Uncharacterized protein n=1 Tax=Vermiconidia calcicola TaxID=1690605 RepID=A0ACC3M9X9_9PEZI|nr:hypothetical protein LTR37_021355 [Vermiconidia calcicola]